MSFAAKKKRTSKTGLEAENGKKDTSTENNQGKAKF